MDAPPGLKSGKECPAEAVRLLVRQPPQGGDGAGGGDEAAAGCGKRKRDGGGDLAPLTAEGALEPCVAFVHPSSVAARLGGGAFVGLSPYVTFHERVLTTKVT